MNNGFATTWDANTPSCRGARCEMAQTNVNGKTLRYNWDISSNSLLNWNVTFYSVVLPNVVLVLHGMMAIVLMIWRIRKV